MTLRELSSDARISLGYISEIERGQKEASSELLASLCDALEVPLSDVLREVSDTVAIEEARILAEAAIEHVPQRRGPVVASAA
ncbi:MAG: DNA-binding protein [Marmoricola sp.]|nr:DNA-binding protein [Marmoricola sp.]